MSAVILQKRELVDCCIANTADRITYSELRQSCARLATSIETGSKESKRCMSNDVKNELRDKAKDIHSDELLMETYRDGDILAFDILFKRYKDMMYRYLVKQSGNAAIAEELFQEVWAGIIKNRDRYIISAKFKTYLFTIAHSKLVDYYRQKSKADLVSYDEHDFDFEDNESKSLEHQADVATQNKKLLVLIDKLPAAQREVFMMHAESGMTLSEIANVVGVTRDTAKSRLRYAVKQLRRYMEKYK